MVTRLKLAREASGLRAYEIARACGITRTQLSLIEGGHAVPAPWLAIRIAAVIGLDVHDLFGGTDEQSQESADEGAGGGGVEDTAGIRTTRRCGPAEAGSHQ